MKSRIRRKYKEKRDQLTEDLVHEYSMKVRKRLYGLQEFLNCDMLFTYISFGNEVDTHEIIRKALSMNKHVYVPRVENKNMSFYRINGFEGLVRSDFGILEPDDRIHLKYTKPLPGFKKVMLLPGLAFDKVGNRIGYGAGYYDRYLGKYPQDEWVKIALAYDFQITDRITVDIYDIPADYIITNDELIICKK
ncbi:MAG TPA: 5-formyltetrahydrofolate cyclo-ligase [Clostridiales bacterium]|nr:5-formyltetrahydrofolate cyclo-ligase [Clostridiales bacterium]